MFWDGIAKLGIVLALIGKGNAAGTAFPINSEVEKSLRGSGGFVRHDNKDIQDVSRVSRRRLGTAQAPTVDVTVDQDCVNPHEEFTGTITITGAGGTTTNALPIEVVFSIDTSGSMGGSRIAAAKNAANSFIDKLEPTRDYVGAVRWASTASDVIDIGPGTGTPQTFTAAKNAINSLSTGGGTNLNVGLVAANNMLSTPTYTPFPPGDSSKVIIFLTDGVGAYTTCANNGPAKTSDNLGITIYSIQIGSSSTAATRLQDMATCTGGKYYEASTVDLQDIFDEIFQTVIDSTVPYNIMAEFFPNAPPIKDFVLDPSTCSPTSPGGLTVNNIDGGSGLNATSTWSCDFSAKSSNSGAAINVLTSSTVTFTGRDDPTTSSATYGPLGVINVNEPPTAVCRDLAFDADDNCEAATCNLFPDVNNGSFDSYDCHRPPGASLDLSQSPGSDHTYLLGETVVTLTADDDKATGTCTATVTVTDVTAPTISCPADISVSNDDGACGADVTFAVTADDNCDASPSIVCTPSSGAFFDSFFDVFFDVGTTSVTCEATDAAGNNASCSFDVTVTDDEDPVVSCPANNTVSNDLGRCGAEVAYDSPMVADNCDDSPEIECTTSSDAFFRVGTTLVTCEATDDAGNKASCSFDITVEDTESPKAICGEGPNPSGNTPQANNTNQDGFFILEGEDNCGGITTIDVIDSASMYLFGSFAPDTTFKYVQAPGGKPSKKEGPGEGEVEWMLKGKGDAQVRVTDTSGNEAIAWCFVPPPPSRHRLGEKV